MKVFKDFFQDYVGKNGELFLNNAEEMMDSNLRILQVMAKVGMYLFFMLFLVSLVEPNYYGMQRVYAAMAIVSPLFYYASLKIPKEFALSLFYGYFFISFFYSVYVSVVLYPQMLCVSALVFVMLMPILILDHLWRVHLLETCFLGIYILLLVLYKDPSVRAAEIVDAMAFSLIGLTVGSSMTKIKMTNIECQRMTDNQKYVDFLTGLYNRRKMFEDISKTEKNNDFDSVAAIMIDIDKFKLYNDSYGHTQGDKCLRKVGQCLKEFEKKHGITFYRFGGEEFSGFCKNYTMEEMDGLCEELNDMVRQMNIPHCQSQKKVVTISVGYAFGNLEQLVSMESLLEKADQALYAAKNSGRDQALSYHAVYANN